MFIQVIQGQCNDADQLHRRMDLWREELEPGAMGFLGGTYGLTDDNEFIGVVRFDSKESAMRNSNRPEQGAWWSETERYFDGPATFHDCDDVQLMLDGGSDDAGFVQVIEGRLDDSERALQSMRESGDAVRRVRPDIIGGLIALAPDGRFTQVVYFTSEEEARKGEAAEAPELDERMAESMSLLSDLTYVDLRQPRLSSPGS